MRHHIIETEIMLPVCVVPALSDLHRIKKMSDRKLSRIDAFITIDEIVVERCKDPEFKVLFERKSLILEIAQMVVDTRKKLGLTQAELAVKAQTTQPVIARLEGGRSRRMPSLDLLAKIAYAMGVELKIGFDTNSISADYCVARHSPM